ncbi:NAD(P)-binding domain, partial [Teratosphaeria destructans]
SNQADKLVRRQPSCTILFHPSGRVSILSRPPSPLSLQMSRAIAFFGATGGCAGHALAHSLNAGYDCRALARTPSKLIAATNEKGVSIETIEKHLTVIEGNVKDVEAVKQTLSLGDGTGRVVDMVVSGIGGTPALQWSLRRPVVLTDRTVCQDAISTILEALRRLKSSIRPSLFTVSTTGISPKPKPRDVPLLFVPFYMWALQDPHEDKKVMEERLADHMLLPHGQQVLETYVNVKASLLMDGPGMGLEKVREGIDEKPAIGYTIQRADVGKWIFERLVDAPAVKEVWRGKSVTVTY